jgi:hypothetical protein
MGPLQHTFIGGGLCGMGKLIHISKHILQFASEITHQHTINYLKLLSAQRVSTIYHIIFLDEQMRQDNNIIVANRVAFINIIYPTTWTN